MEKLPFEAQELRKITKKDSNTNPDYGCTPEKRSMPDLINTGIINLNKPAGPSSHQVSAYLQQILNIKKSGHSGTLDPQVSGVLPVALASATRIVQALLPAGKEYIAIMHLHKDIDNNLLLNSLKSFTGKITQLPPVKSAVKRQYRQREVYYTNILEREGKDVLLKIGCQAGTYIRKFIHDLGKQLKCGAHMKQLIRTKAGPFTDKTWHSLQDVKDAYISYIEHQKENELRSIVLPFESAVSHIPKIWVHDSAVFSLYHGSPLAIPGVSIYQIPITQNQEVAIMTLKNELIGLATLLCSQKDLETKDHGTVAAINKVFMQPNIYPKIDKSVQYS